MKETTAHPRDPAAPPDGGTPAPGPSEAPLRPGSGKLTSHPSGEWPTSIPCRKRPLRSQPGGPARPEACRTAKEPHAWRSLGLAGAGLGADAGLAISSRDLGAVLALTEVTVLAVIALTILIAVLCGSDNTCERAFRLLRWLANRPEPPGARHRA